MARLGLNDRPEVYEYWTGQSRNQHCNRYTTPAQRIKVLELGSWIRGVQGYGDCSYRLCVWDADGKRIAITAVESVGQASVAVGNLLEKIHPLSVPLELEASVDIYVGVSRSPGNAMQLGYHDHGPAGNHTDDLSSGMGDSLAGSITHTGTGAVGSWIEDYQIVSGAWAYRGGTWNRAAATYAERGGSAVEADNVQVRRGGSWIDAD